MLTQPKNTVKMENHNIFTGAVFLFGTLLLVSDQVYRLYKIQDKTFFAGNKSNYLLYDGFFFSIYYAFGTSLYFALGGLMLLSPSPNSIFWRLLSTILKFTFFAECEAILEFIFYFNQIGEHLAMTSWNLNMFFALLILGMVRLAVAFIMIVQMFALEENIIKDVFGFIKSKSKLFICLVMMMLINHLITF